MTRLSWLGWALLSLTAASAQTSWQNLVDRGATLELRGRDTEARTEFLAANMLAQSFDAADPRRAYTLNRLCAIDYQLSQVAEAEKFCGVALSERQRDTVESLSNTANSLHLLASLHLLQGRETRARETIERMQALLDSSPVLPHFRGLLLYDSAFLDLIEHHPADAESKFLQAAEYFRADKADAHALATTLAQLSRLLIARHRYASAENFTHEALAILTAGYGEDHPEMILNDVNLARVYLYTKRKAEAASLLRHAMSIAQSSGPDEAAVAIVARPYSEVLERMGQHKQAKDMARLAETIVKRVQGNSPSRYIVDAKALAKR